MTTPKEPEKDYHLNRFLEAQEDDYEQALTELRLGRKESHWMWYIFPQLEGLGVSATSKYYALSGIAEATAYLNHPVLGTRLLKCVEAVLELRGLSAFEIFGSPDDLKLRSCATLFAAVSRDKSAFHRLIDKYFDGEPDENTLRLLRAAH